MKKRFITSIVMALVLIPLLIIQSLNIGFKVLITILLIVGTLELLQMYDKEKKTSWKLKVGVILLTVLNFASISLFSNIESSNDILYICNRFIFTFLLSIIVLYTMFVLNDEITENDLRKFIFIIIYAAFGAGSLLVLKQLGVRFVIYLLLITFLTDIFAYLVGIKIGKHKMAPKISPKKSWEGAIFGTLIATVIATTVGIFYGKIFSGGIINPEYSQTILDGILNLQKGNSASQAVIIFLLTIMISIFGQIGDLIASKLKRSYEIKDFGHIFPGHGGVFDRFDSTFFAAPIFLFMIMAILQIG